MPRRPAPSALAWGALVLATACACAAPSSTTQPPSSPSSAASAAVTISAGPQTFSNPVIDADFPDPFVAAFEGTYYAYATGTGGKLLQVSTSTDLVTWEIPSEALLRVPSWMAGDTWAPEVARLSGGYVMYYSGRYPAVDRPNGEGALCISAAVAETASGPFSDQSDEPLLCQPELGGDIDATTFIDPDGTPYLIWKNDGNCCGIPTEFWIQELAADGLAMVGDEPTKLGMKNDVTWEDGVIEAPTLIHADETYYLFFSANRYDTHRYAVGYATASTLTGPYTDAAENPILVSAAPAVGPGHQSVFVDDDGDFWMAYHAWDVSALGYQAGGRRALWIDPLVFDAGKPDVVGPNASPQPIP